MAEPQNDEWCGFRFPVGNVPMGAQSTKRLMYSEGDWQRRLKTTYHMWVHRVHRVPQIGRTEIEIIHRSHR